MAPLSRYLSFGADGVVQQIGEKASLSDWERFNKMAKFEVPGKVGACTPLVLLLVLVASPLLLEGRRQVPATDATTSAPIVYRVTFPEPEHHWMQVEVTFPRLRRPTLDVRMSRSSPGRYAVAEFAKNVFSLEAFNGRGQKLS